MDNPELEPQPQSNPDTIGIEAETGRYLGEIAAASVGVVDLRQIKELPVLTDEETLRVITGSDSRWTTAV